MRFLPICCLIWMQLGALGLAQSTNQIIPLAERTHNFGTVATAANTEHRFVLRNPFQQDLHIRGVRASCGCTTPIVIDETIKPGQKGTILARFNTDRFYGQKAATLTVSFDRPFFSELQLNVRGYIRRDIVVYPGKAEFAQVPQGENQEIELTLNYAGRPDWKIENVVSPQKFIRAEFEELSRNGRSVSYKLIAKLEKNAPLGVHQGEFVLQTNDRRLTEFPVSFIANIEASLQASPKLIKLKTASAKGEFQQRLVLKALQPFTIEDIQSDIAEVEFSKPKTSKKAHIVNLSITRDQVNKARSGVLSIKTDIRDQPLEIPLAFELSDEAGLASSSDNLQSTVSAER